MIKRIHLGWKALILVVILALMSAYILNASQPGQTVEGCPQGCAKSVERRAGPMRVLSLNMLHNFPDFKDLPLRLELIAAEIQRLDADVVLLQEVPWTRGTGNGAEYLAQQLGYNYVYYRANGNKKLIFFEEGEAILSRFLLKDLVSTELPPRVGFFESRVSLGATAITPGGEVSFFVAHLTDKDPQVDEGQAEALRRFVGSHSSGLAVVGGDFNAQEDTPQIMELTRVWTDTYRVVHPSEAGLTCCIDDLNASPEEPLEERIDYIFLVNQSGESRNIISAKKVFDQPFRENGGWQWASDHVGLMLEIEP